MSDVTSPEAIAFQLLRLVAIAENINLPGLSDGTKDPERKWILDTYAECRETVYGGRRGDR